MCEHLKAIIEALRAQKVRVCSCGCCGAWLTCYVCEPEQRKNLLGGGGTTRHRPSADADTFQDDFFTSPRD